MSAEDAAIIDLVRRIHQTPHRACLVITGVGSQALAWLFGTPGASRTVLDAQVPYSTAALDEYVGGPARQHVSAAEATRMAVAALSRARKLAAASGLDPSVPLIGLGCTGAIATDRVRRGDDRVHVAWTDGTGAKAYSLVFILREPQDTVMGARDRKGEERVSSMLILNALAEACGLPDLLPIGLLPGEAVVVS